jgi:hypothetical protein
MDCCVKLCLVSLPVMNPPPTITDVAVLLYYCCCYYSCDLLFVRLFTAGNRLYMSSLRFRMRSVMLLSL